MKHYISMAEKAIILTALILFSCATTHQTQWMKEGGGTIAAPKGSTIESQLSTRSVSIKTIAVPDISSIRRESLIVSPDGRRIAYAVQEGVSLYMIVDGNKEGPYAGLIGGAEVFSPDSKRFAYGAIKQGGKRVAIVDGKEFGGEFDSLPHIAFSPDSQRIVLLAGIGKKRFVSVDGKPGKHYDAIGTGNIVFSPDSKRLAYAAIAGERWIINVDESELAEYDGIPDNSIVFSPDGKRMGYRAKRGDHVVAVIDGKETRPDQEVLGGPVFSPDSNRIGYVAEAGTNMFAVIDGKEQTRYDIADSIRFSADSRRAAYAAKSDGKWFVVVDGIEQNRYDRIGEGTPIFSPDGRRFAYGAGTGDKMFVVIDGKQGAAYSAIGETANLIFSPDGKRIAYHAVAGGKQFVVVDGKEGKHYDGIGRRAIAFSPDSKDIAYAARLGSKWFVVVNGVEGIEHDGLVTGARIVFDSRWTFHYLAGRSGQIVLIEETLK